MNEDRAAMLAIIEGAERYAGNGRGLRGVRTCIENDLPDNFLSPTGMARFSSREIEHPTFPCSSYSPDLPIRWIHSHELTSERDIWIPLVSAAYNATNRVPNENFQYGISTGWAAHSNLTQSIIGSLSEVLERDALSITWQQKMSLPRILPRGLPSDVQDIIASLQEEFIDPVLLDATTDIGLPIVICVLHAEHSESVHNLVGAGTGNSLAQATEKAVLEAVCLLPSMHKLSKIPPSTIEPLMRNPMRMAHQDNDHHWENLRSSLSQSTADPFKKFAKDPAAILDRLIEELRNAHMTAALTVTTPGEFNGAGLFTTSVVIPEAVPMSPIQGLQYRGTPRLYTLPETLGYQSFQEGELHSCPIPFG